MTSRYAETYERWRATREALLGGGRCRDRLGEARGRRSSTQPSAFTAAGSSARSATPASTASTGTRPSVPTQPPSSTTAPSRREADQLPRPARRSSGARRRPAGPRRRKGRPRHPLSADDPGGGDCDARLRAARRNPFRRLRRLRSARARHPHRRCPPEARHLRLLRHRAWPHCPLQAAARRGDRTREAQAGGVPHPAARGGTLRDGRRPRPRFRRGHGAGARARDRLRAGQGDRPALHPLHLGHDGPAERHRARQWRAHGRAEMVDAGVYGIDPGEMFWAASDVGWVVGHSYIVYAPLLHGCASVLYEGKPVGTPDAGAFWRVISEHNVAALFTAPTAFRAIAATTPRATLSATTSPTSAPCSSPASAPTPPRSNGRSIISACLSSIIGGRRRRAGRSAPTRPGSACCRSSYGSPGVPMPGYDLQVLDDAGHPVAARHARQHRGEAAAAPELPADAVECGWALPRRLSRRVPGLLQDRRRRLSSTPTATPS